MPLYVYYHRDCDVSFELRRPLEERNAPVECPECDDGSVMRRVFTAPTSKIAGLAADRFRYEDKIARNRQNAHEEGLI